MGFEARAQVGTGCSWCRTRCSTCTEQTLLSLTLLLHSHSHLRQGEAVRLGGAQPVGHCNRQEPLLAVLAAGIHCGVPVAHGPCSGAAGNKKACGAGKLVGRWAGEWLGA
jgi:hypothetical protein